MNEILLQEMRSIWSDLNLQLNLNFCDITHMNHTDWLGMFKIFPLLWRPSICIVNYGAFVESLFSYASQFSKSCLSGITTYFFNHCYVEFIYLETKE